jgi:selenocysteine-specific elongation factor
VILGTAGHIDHGKTALVKALTGVDTDRLPEEKRRGITIDLGFAPLVVPGIGTVGIVDVPGHEAFVRTMLAGASGIDIALLVVAADEGVMPQTREHLEILSLLAIQKVVVALTKRDLVSDEWLALAADDVHALLAETSFAESKIVAVSAVTGEGLPELRDAIRAAAAAGQQRRSADDLFRMPVDRAFTVKGTGTVVTGTVWSGSIGRDATVTVFPPGRQSRVRGIQRHGEAVKTAAPGERVALALADLDVEEVGRGSIVIGKTPWPPTTRIEVEINTISDEIEIGPRTRLRFHLGTSDVGARISRSATAESADQKTRLAVIVLEEPLLVRTSDRFVLRLPSPALTIGGGIVRDPFPPSRKKAASRAAVGETPRDLLARIALDAGVEGLEDAILPIRLGVPGAQAATLARDLGLVAIQSRLYDQRVLEALESDVERTIREHVENFPLDAGVQLQSLRSGRRAPTGVMGRILDRLVERSRIEIDGSVARPTGWSPKLTDRERAVVDRMLHDICIQPSEPPAVSELVASFGEKASGLLRFLERTGELVKVSDDRYYSPAAVEAMVGKLRSTLRAGRVYSPAELREVLGVSRKYLIPFLEFCDHTGVTDRKAEGRVLGVAGKRDQS